MPQDTLLYQKPCDHNLNMIRVTYSIFTLNREDRTDSGRGN